MWKQSINLVLGVWLMASSFSISLQNPTNLVIVGLTVWFAGFLSFKSWQGIASGLSGAWLFFCGITGTLITPLNFLISGLIITIVCFWDLQIHNDVVAHRH